MLEIKGISKSYSDKLVLDDVSFVIPKGEIFGIIGPNGAGKTTTLRIILGIITSSTGEVIFEGKEISDNFQNMTGYLPEERGLYPKSTVKNTLVYLAQLKGLSYKLANEKYYYWLERLNLMEFENFHIEDLSKGNQQKVQFISAIIHDPKILILDEPFSGFDPVNQSIFREIIEEFKTGRYIILSTHLMDLAESLCSDIFLINEGKKILSGKLSYLLESGIEEKLELEFHSAIDEYNFQFFEKFKILHKGKKSITIESNKNIHQEIISNISRLRNLMEIKVKKPTLHELFMASVKSGTRN